MSLKEIDTDNAMKTNATKDNVYTIHMTKIQTKLSTIQVNQQQRVKRDR